MQKQIFFFVFTLIISSFIFSSDDIPNIDSKDLRSNLDYERVSGNYKNVFSLQLQVPNKKQIIKGTLRRHELSSYNQLISYDSYLFSISENILYLYNKDLSVNWEHAITSENYRDFYIEFDTIYAIDNNHNFTTFSIKSGLKQVFDDIKLNTFNFNFPFLFYENKNLLGMLDVTSKATLWQKDGSCDQKVIVPSSKLVGCLKKSSLVFFDTINGKVTGKLDDKRLVDSSYLDATNSYVFFKSLNNEILQVNLDEYSIKSTGYFITNLSFMFRQKELVQFLSEDNTLRCIDLVSKKIKWEYIFDQPTETVISNSDYLLMQLPSQNINVIDSYNGKSVTQFQTEEDLGDINNFYKFKNKWYLFDHGKNLVKIIDDNGKNTIN